MIFKSAMESLKILVYYLLVLIFCTFLVVEYNNYNAIQEEKQQIQRQIEQQKQNEKDCIKAALWYEARGESPKGIEAVASVIQNRVQHKNYPSTYCGVIQQHKQFSFTLFDKPVGDALEASIKPQEQQKYMQVVQLSEKMLEGEFEPILPSSVLHYAHVKISNAWTKTKQTYVRIGNHRFYATKEK